MRARPRRVGGGLHGDGTATCEDCGLPLFPFGVDGDTVRLECANHHHAVATMPPGEAARRAVTSWITRRGAQLHAQHERWGTDEED